MPDKIDITGWREELKELYKSDFYQERWMADEVEDYPIPASKLFELMEILTTRQEFIDCYNEIDAWFQADTKRNYIRDDDPDNPTFPHHATKKLKDFELWFCLKNSLGPNDWAFSTIHQICGSFLRGEYPAIDGQEVSQIFSDLRHDGARIDWGS